MLEMNGTSNNRQFGQFHVIMCVRNAVMQILVNQPSHIDQHELIASICMSYRKLVVLKSMSVPSSEFAATSYGGIVDYLIIKGPL
jgi:hypothetical protein